MDSALSSAVPDTADSSDFGCKKKGPASFAFRLSTQNMGIDLDKELEGLKERNKEDKRLKEKFPRINGEPTWLLRHIEILQEEYAKNGWEYEIEIPTECQHRLYPSIIGPYLIFTRQRKFRKGKVIKEYIPVPLSKGASWEFWKPMDDDARPPTAGRLEYIPPPGPGERTTCTGLLGHDLGRYLNASDEEEDSEDSTNDGFGALPEDRPRRRVIPGGPSSSDSDAEQSAYNGRYFNTAPSSAQSRSQDIMGTSANYAPDRSLRSRKASNISTSSTSTDSSSSSHISRMSNGSEHPEDYPDEDEDADDEEEDVTAPTPTCVLEGRSRVIQSSDSDNDSDDDDDYPVVYNPKSIKAKRGLSDVIEVSDNEEDDLPPPNSKYRKNGRSAIIEISDEDNDSDWPKPVRKPKAVHGKKNRQEIIEIFECDAEVGSDGFEDDIKGHDEGEVRDEDENIAGGSDDVDDDEWFDESGYCKFCYLHQHECECIHGDDNYPLERGEEDDDDYKN
ncbi:hypothetical protein BKA65DRAFT_555240 [Rhexocercosporidium sp. MPI-PUGE-AT-0058]|nr:hypothetical protein BKA65DRAFT_555240 [Rhexocercosporidium sp. MPI-PUGE-AT-0058]